MDASLFQQKNVSYSRLAPFAAAFDDGLPILTYHKVGPRPRGLKLKSIQMPERIFRRQMKELAENGFKSTSLDRWREDAKRRSLKFIITFDDGSRGVLENAEKHLAAQGFQAIQYLVADRIGGINQWDADKGEAPDALMDEAEVREWMARGHEIGSHTLTHPNLATLSPEQAREEILASKKKLEDRFGVAIRHFCYPYGKYTAAVRDLVKEAGYETAVTLKAGVNVAETAPHELLRIGARHETRNFRAVVKRFFGS